MEPIIEFRSVVHSYGHQAALTGVSFQVPQGSATALLGPSGAGKSTALQIAVNLLKPTGGDVRILGTESTQLGPKELRRLGYVADGMELPLGMQIQEYLAWCRPMYPSWDRDLERELLRDFHLTPDQKLRTLSRGQRMKASLLSCLAYRPELLVLDEPFSGLDPVMREEFIAGLLEMAGQDGWAMLIASHDIEEVEKLADRVVMLNYSRVKLEESTEALLARHRLVEVLLPAEVALGNRDAEVKPLHQGWLQVRVAGRLVRFVDSHYDAEKLAAAIRQHFPNAVDHTASGLTLREVCLLLMRPTENLALKL